MNRAITLSAIAAVALAGCTQSEETGARLSVDYFAGTDVVGFHFEIERVACDASDTFKPFSTSANVDLVDGIFPGMISFLESAPFDEESRHTGADLFISLDPGCYEIVAAPASAVDGDDWTPSADCSTASSSAEVTGGATTEVVLLSQCVGDETGALDTLVLLNHPPEISVSIDEKYNYECEPVNACVTWHDDDDDPAEVVWAQESGTAGFSLTPGASEVIGFEAGHRIWRQCAEIVTRWTDSYDYSVTVYDLGYSGGSLVRIEDIVGEDSHSGLTFPIHTNWIEEPLCVDDVSGSYDTIPIAGSEILRADGCGYTSAQEYYCDMKKVPELYDYLCDENGVLIDEALYPLCSEC